MSSYAGEPSQIGPMTRATAHGVSPMGRVLSRFINCCSFRRLSQIYKRFQQTAVSIYRKQFLLTCTIGIMSGRGKGDGKSKAKPKSRSSRAGLHFPIGRVHRLLRNGNYSERVGAGAPVYLAAILEYLSTKRFRVDRQRGA